MEIVVLNSDIARLVLDYLKSQKLKRATHTFCKTSPYLKQEFYAYKQGLQTHSFFPELKEIICEYVKISRKVEHLLPKLTNALRVECQQRKLSDKVADIIDSAIQALTNPLEQSTASSPHTTTNDTATTQTFNAIPKTHNSLNSDKENNNNIKIGGKKRKRSIGSSSKNLSSNDEYITNTKARSGIACWTHSTKKRLKMEPYCFLSSKAFQRHTRRHNLRRSHCTTDELGGGGENEAADEDWTQSSNDDVTVETEEDNDGEEGYNEENEDDLFESGKPTKESTPRSKSETDNLRRAPIPPEISQAILENPEFQQRLVENINQALNNSSSIKANLTTVPSDQAKFSDQNIDEPPIISSSQLLDQMIRNILDVTEKDPSFDAIIHEVVEASNNPPVHSTAVQCNIAPHTGAKTIPEGLVAGVNNSVYTAAEPTETSSSKLPHILPKPTQHAVPTNILNVNAVTAPAPPRTPLIIRTAVAAANASVIGSVGSAQDLPNVDANNSFGSLIDPNFSISKLIVLNSNESAQKQHPDATLGNTTAENIISQLSTSQLTTAETVVADDQVYYDPTSGQLTFPVFLTNEGLLANFPFLVNNEVITQQLQANNLANLDSSRIEIPLDEPIKITPDQLPQNSIILGSSQKSQSGTQSLVKQQTASKADNVTESQSETKAVCSTGPPASLDSKMMADKATPSASGIVNSKAYKSLSTPRKRTSHVRALTFSPRGSFCTPLSTRRDTNFNRFQRTLPKTIPETLKENLDESSKASEKPIIKNVEILPKLPGPPNDTLKDVSSVSASESNGNVPPLFVTEENSNQTVINKQIGKDVIEVTPKKPQIRKSAARSCKRQVTRTPLDLDQPETKSEKENEVNIPAPGTVEYNEYMMAQWKLQRNCSGADFDVRLRELNAKMSHLQPVKKVNPKKRVRRKKPAAIKRKEKELAEEAEELEMSRQLEEEQNLQLSPGNVKVNESENANPAKSGDEQESEKALDYNSKNEVDIEERQLIKNDKKKKSKEFLIKIPTPQKPSNDGASEKVKSKKEKLKESKIKGSATNTKQAVNNKTKTVEITDEENIKLAKTSNSPSFQVPIGDDHQQHQHHDIPAVAHENEALEREKRTGNIAFLLETPFKSVNLSEFVPPTPGIFAPTMETPVGKNRDPHDDMHASTSFLFGSLTKSELDTPMLNAITPGFRFTPFGLKEAGTPRSVTGTEYSSGAGSYYKPDESENLDRNIDKILRDSAQKKQHQEGSDDTEDRADGGNDLEEGEIQTDAGQVDEVEVEIAVKTLKVEPIVLKRIQSFGSEPVDSEETARIDPHYTLASGLPEISADETSSSSSSSSSSKSSSCSSSNCSCSSSSSSSHSNQSANSKTVLEVKTPLKVHINELENLSEISSTEDEEWQRLAVTDIDENSQLVNNNGEIRYPVRSWLTPIKESMTMKSAAGVVDALATPPSTIKVTLPVKSAEKRNRQTKELEQKRERLKAKLKNDAKKEKTVPTVAAAPNISQALAATRYLHAMRDKGKKPSCFDPTQRSNSPETADDKRSIDVLTALNLSAKKQQPKTPEFDTSTMRYVISDAPTIEDKDDENASLRAKQQTPNIVITTPEIKEHPNVNISSAYCKTPVRKCLPIEARPVIKTIKKTTKKIVRTPLSFKTIQSPGKVNPTTIVEITTQPTDLMAPTLVQTQAVRVSPRLLKPKKSRLKKSEESPKKKTQSNTRNSKGKAAVQRSNNKKIESPKKQTKAKANKTKEEQTKDVQTLATIKSEVEDSQPEGTSPITIKPKIHLKAGKVLGSTKNKNKTNKSDDQTNRQVAAVEEPKLKQKEIIVHELKEEEQTVSENSITPTPSVTSTIVAESAATEERASEDTSEDDPYESFDITTTDESDAKRFIHCTYDEDTDKPNHNQKISQNIDLASFQMVVSLDDRENHVWTVTEGVCLFSYTPESNAETQPLKQQTIRNIPKKRKVRVTSSSDDKTKMPISSQHVTNINTKIAPPSLKAFTSAANPGATSTPINNQQQPQQQPRIEGQNSKDGMQTTSKSNQSTKSTLEFSTKPPVGATNKSEEPKIQIEDIESILSHLHGT